MEWQDIISKARIIKENFDRAYKCLNIDRPIKEGTTKTYFGNLCQCLEEIGVLFNVHFLRLTKAHKTAAESFFQDLTNIALKLATRKEIEIELQTSIHEAIEYKFTLPSPNVQTDNMARAIVDFLSTASKLISDFDGKSKNLRSYIDSLTLVDSIKRTHESVAVSLIKTKLKGNARNLKDTENTIADIITKLYSVKAETVEVLTAKNNEFKTKQ